MTKKDVECQIHMWMIKKAKKPQYIRRGRGKRKGEIAKACQKRLLATFEACVFNLFTLKPNILAQDQTSSLSCTLQIHYLGYVGLDPFLFWIQVKFGPYKGILES